MFRLKLLGLFLAAILSTALASAADSLHLYMKGSRMGVISGPKTMDGLSGWFEAEIISGIRGSVDEINLAKSIVIRIPSDQAKGQFYNALVSNETIIDIRLALIDRAGRTRLLPTRGYRFSKLTISKSSNGTTFEDIVLEI